MKRTNPHHRSGFSLIVCLIILTLLSIMVVSFISTTTSERTTSKAYLNKATAELAANTAVNQAISQLTENITRYPDSATVWETLNSTGTGGRQAEGTVLYYNESGPNLPAGNRGLIPLVSRADKDGNPMVDGVLINDKKNALGSVKWDDKHTIDLNRRRFDNDQDGWIGQHPTLGLKPYYAQWINVKDKTAAAAAATPTPGAPTPAPPRTIARYAYWVEDESFKLNLNLLRNTKRDTEAEELNRDLKLLNTDAFYKTHPERAVDFPGWRAPIQGLLRNAPGLPFNKNDDVSLTSLADSTFSLRDQWFGKQFFELRAFNRADPKVVADPKDPKGFFVADRAKFLATIFSGGLNLTRQGTQRVNLNRVVFNTAASLGSGANVDPLAKLRAVNGWQQYNATDTDVEKQLRQIVETIRYHAPKFGERFYRKPAGSDRDTDQVSANYRNIYLYKLAANIRDYMDPDLVPTVFKYFPGTNAITMHHAPANRLYPEALNAFAISNPAGFVWVQGKDSGPYLQEAAVRYRSELRSSSAYRLTVDYYLEFWNMGTKDVYAVAQPGINEPHALLDNPFVVVSGQQKWVEHPSGVALRATDGRPPVEDVSRDLIVDLTTGVFRQGRPEPRGVIFPAGACTVITTDPDYLTRPANGATSPAFSGGYRLENIYYCSNLKNPSSANPSLLVPGKRVYEGTFQSSSTTGIKPDFRDGGEDYDTEVTLGNSRGVIDSHPAAIAMGGGAKIATSGNPRDDWYGGTLLGNGTAPSQLGDPRTNNEMMIYTRFMSGASTSEPDQARYFNTVGPPRFSLGYPNSLYVLPHQTGGAWTQWPDYYYGWLASPQNEAPQWALPSGAQTFEAAPAYVYNGRSTVPDNIYDPALRSIGQLGDVFDPARVNASKGTLDIEGARGGGRSLRIGQPDGWTSGTPPADRLVNMSGFAKASQQWAAWRLTDMFSTTSELYLPGLININGVNRDRGAALRAACYGMAINSVAKDPGDATGTVTPVRKDLDSRDESGAIGVKTLVDQAINRLNQTDITKPSYFRERGEISELAVFSGSASDYLTGVKMSSAFDRTREEFGRRMIDLITTRGSVFSVYVVGQSVVEAKDPTKEPYVTGEHWRKVTFALLPRNADGTDFKYLQGTSRLKGDEDWSPYLTSSAIDNNGAFGKRFYTDSSNPTSTVAKPDHYDVQILQVASP